NEECFCRDVMKLRIRGNSVRIRVSRSELERIAEEGLAEDAVRFAPDVGLVYRVRVVTDGRVSAELEDGVLTVTLPKATVERWTRPDEVSIRGEQPIGGGETLKILVEKDFECLTPREGEDQSDLFPNPAQG